MTWQPAASIEILKQRADLVARIRSFFTQRGYLEVETPIMSRYGVTDVYLHNIQASCLGQKTWLHTSPEYAMKRLLAAGSGPIFQIARVFRDEELGRWHNPEFSLLEWYQLDIDHHALMVEVDLFLQAMLHSKPMLKTTYRKAFLDACGIDPLTADLKILRDVLAHYQLDRVLDQDESDRDQFLFLLMSHIVEPYLATYDAPYAVYDFPESQAALARIDQHCAARFEVYYRGIELANGFYELTDPVLQAMRFDADRQQRHKHGLPDVEIDPNFIAALAHGLPECSGVALGVDRLLAIAFDQKSLSAVMAFDFERV